MHVVPTRACHCLVGIESRARCSRLISHTVRACGLVASSHDAWADKSGWRLFVYPALTVADDTSCIPPRPHPLATLPSCQLCAQR